MPEYLLSGRDPRGKSVTERVDATSADEAVQIARETLGLDRVVLHTDDAGALYSRQADVAEHISPRDFLRFRDLPAPLASFLVMAKLFYMRWFWVMLLAAGILAFRRRQGRPWGAIDWLETVILLSPCLLALVPAFFRGLAGEYNRLIDAVAWGRWQEVLDLTTQLEGSKIPPEELAFHRAKALSGLGRFDEGLAVVAPFGDGTTIPQWMYYSRLSDVYRVARRINDAQMSLDRSLELAPDNPTVMIDVGLSDTRHGRDPQRARDLLKRAREHALSDVLVPFASRLEGQILLAEARPAEAIPLLEDALRRLSAFRHASPLIGNSIDYTEAAVALAHAAAGHPDVALQHARRALPRLRVHNEDDLLARLRAAVGPALDE